MRLATIALLAAPALLLPLAYLVWWLDRFRLYPLARFVAVFALAVSAGALLAARWPAPPSAALAGPAMPAAGALGERAAELAVDAARLALAALAVLAFLLARGRVESPVDGAVFGVAAGVGLALPAAWLLAESAPDAGPAALLGRALAGVAAGALVGLGVAYARFDPRWSLRVAAALAGAIAATAVVAGAGLAADLSRPWVEPVLLGVAVAATAAAAVALELAIARRELAEEASLGVVPGWAAEVLPRYWRRVRGAWWPRRDERRALSRLLLELAFRKHQLRRLDDGRATLYSLEVGRLRERARRLLDPARGGVAAPGGEE